LTANVAATYLQRDSLDEVPEHLHDMLEDVEFNDIGETNNTGIPVPWMLYFGAEDFQMAQVMWDEDTVYNMAMPCTSVEKARERILAALPVFERLAGDAALGREYWQEALDVLADLPYPFLALDQAEWIGSNSEDPEVDARRYKAVYDAGVPSDANLINLCAYTENVAPYSHEEWTRLVTHFDWDNKRQMNAIVLGYGHAL